MRVHNKFGKKVVKKVCLLMALVVGIGCVVPAYATTKQDAEDKIDKLEDDKKELEEYVDSLESLKSDTEAYIAELDTKMNDYTLELIDLQTTQATLESEIADTQEQLVQAEEDIAIQYDAMKLRIKNMYENGNKQFLELMLESENITDFLNRAEYITQISEYDRGMLTKMQETKDLIEQSKATLEAQKAEQEVLIASLETKQAELQILVDAKEEQMHTYQTSIEGAESEIGEIEAQIAVEEAVIAEIERIEQQRKEEEEKKNNANNNNVSNEKPVVSSKGFIWPCPGYHRITSAYGYRTHPVTGERYKMHNGVDVGAPTGATLVAVADGEVAWANYSSSAGNWIGIDHGNGVYSVYMHCSKLYVSAGQKVSQGDTVGLVGATGRVTGPHLHFAIRVNGSYVNPHPYIGY